MANDQIIPPPPNGATIDKEIPPPPNDAVIDQGIQSPTNQGFLDSLSQAWTQAKNNPAYSTSPQGLLEEGYGLANKAAGKVGDIAENYLTGKSTPLVKNMEIPGAPNPINPIVAKGINKFISAGPALTTLAMPTEPAKGLEEKAGELAVKSENMPAGILINMTDAERKNLGQFLMDNDLVGMDKGEILKKVKSISDEFGQRIGEMAEKTEGVAVSPEDHYQVVSDLLNKSKEYENSKFLDGVKLSRDYARGADEILNLPANPTWNDIQGLKERTGRLAFDSKGEIKNKAIADTYFKLKDMLTGLAEKAKSDPNVPNEYKEVLAGYARMQPLENGLEKSVDAELRGATGTSFGFHPMRMLAGMPKTIRYPAGVLATATGHPILGAAAVLPELMNPAIQSKIVQGASQAIPATTKAIPTMDQMISDYLKNQYGNQ